MSFNAAVSIIDDDEVVRNPIQSLLQLLGYNVHTFASAEEFLTSRQLHQTSCVISDVQMPGHSGIELEALLRADGHRIPVILVTGHPERVRDRVVQAGAASFLSKPIEADLIRCLERALKVG